MRLSKCPAVCLCFIYILQLQTKNAGFIVAEKAWGSVRCRSLTLQITESEEVASAFSSSLPSFFPLWKIHACHLFRLLTQTSDGASLATSPGLKSKRIRIYLLWPFIDLPSPFSDSSLPRRVWGRFDVTVKQRNRRRAGERIKGGVAFTWKFIARSVIVLSASGSFRFLFHVSSFVFAPPSSPPTAAAVLRLCFVTWLLGVWGGVADINSRTFPADVCTWLVSVAVTAWIQHELTSFRRSAALILSHAIGCLAGDDGPVCQRGGRGGGGVRWEAALWSPPAVAVISRLPLQASWVKRR